MQRRGIYSKIIYVLVFISLIFGIFAESSFLYAETDPEAQLEEKEEEKEEKEDELEQSEHLEGAYLDEGLSISQRLVEIDKQLDGLTEDVETRSEELKQEKEDLEKKRQDLDDKKRDLEKLSQELYKFSFVNVLEVIFSSDGTGDIMQKMGFIRHGMGSLVGDFRDINEELKEFEKEYRELEQKFGKLKDELAELEEKKVALENQKRIYQIKAASEAARQEDLMDDIADLVSDIENLSQEAQDAIESKTGDGEQPGGGDGNPGGGDSPQDPIGDTGSYDIYRNGELVASGVAGPIRFTPEGASYFSVDSGAGRYRGILELRADSNVFVINELDLELYLRGIGEMSSSWPVEALKSQAVIARTYAVANWGKRSDYGYNLRDDTYDQNYVGYNKESASYGERWVSAVRSTEAEVLYSGSNVISAYYHSTCGGHTLSSAEVWGGSRSYATAKSDWYMSGNGLISYDAASPWSYKRWCGSSNQSCTSAENINNSEMEDLLNASLYLAVNPESQTRQNEVRRPDLGGLTSSQIEARLGSGNTITDRIGNITNVQSVYSSGGTSLTQSSRRTVAIRVTGTAGSLDIDATPFWLVFNVRAPGSAHIFYSNFWSVNKEGGSWNFYTRGYPHRVGLCQYGAYGRANAGQSYSSILTHYYNGTSLKTFTPGSAIRIGLTRVGGSTTLISANGEFGVYGKGELIENGFSGETWRIVKR